MFPNNVSSLSIQIKPMNQIGSFLVVKVSQFELAYLFWLIVCNIRGRPNQVGHGLNCTILSRDHSKSKDVQNYHILHPFPLAHVNTLLIKFTHALCEG